MRRSSSTIPLRTEYEYSPEKTTNLCIAQDAEVMSRRCSKKLPLLRQCVGATML
jgi:hypothetical protein